MGSNSTFSSHARLTIVTMAFMGMLVTYVETMITPALPTLVTFFSTNYDTLAWVITGYILAGTVSAAIFGRLADMYGKKRIFVILATIYSVAITLGGFARSLDVFVAIRAVQGLGMGMFPVAFALLNDQVPKRNLALAQGILSSTFIGGTAVGLVGGAWITQNFGWEWSYHSAIPLAYFLAILAATSLKDTPLRVREKLDFFGVTFLSIGLVSLILGISEGQYWGWYSMRILGTFAVSALSLSLFVYMESKASHPFISMKLLRIKNVFLSNFAGLFVMSAMFFMFFTVPPMLEDPAPAGFSESVLTAGLSMLPAALTSMAFAPISALITRNRGPKTSILIGNLVVFIAYVGFYFNRASIDAILEDATMVGVGMSFVFVGIINILLLSTPESEAGASTGMNVVFRNIGSAIAPAVGGVFETTFVQYAIVGYMPGSIAGLPFIPIFHSFPSSIAFSDVYLVGMIFLVVSVIFTFMMNNIVIRKEENFQSVALKEG
ncbi:MAG: MFS transporter [Nitrososphaerota archaeon]|nr:MFS transporter [Nitrososphaerota archaeon]